MAGIAVLIGGAVLVGLWWYFKLKQRHLARAYTFLTILSRPGSTVESSNWVALSVDMYAANQVQQALGEYVEQAFNGSRPAMLAEARAQGFRG